MAFQRVPNTVALSVIYLQNGVNMQNSFYGEFNGTYSQSDLDALAANVDTTVAAEWLPLQTVNSQYIRTEAKGLDAENDFVAEASAGAGLGQDVAEGLPNSITLSIKKSSGLSGRSARGRIYWMGTPASELQTNENFIKTAYIDSVELAVDKIRDAINASFLFEAVLVSRFANKVQRVLGVTFTWISTTCVDTVVDTQRGRLS